MPLYQLYELNHAVLHPARAVADASRMFFEHPLNPLSHTAVGRSLSASLEIFERTTRRYGKPEFGIDEVTVDGKTVAVEKETVWSKPFCRLLHFVRDLPPDHPTARTKLLIVAPMSGHYATLLRGTVQKMLEQHDVYITDWTDARMVPLAHGTFDLDDYIDYLLEMFALFKGDVHVLAVCQPSVPVFAAVSLLEAARDPNAPHSMTLMGGPIDTRVNPTAANSLVEKRDLDWFRKNVIMAVPWPHPGAMRHVYPGFLQLTGFMTMNLDRHLDAHKELFKHLIAGDGDSAEKHREFYDEFLAVMDLDAPFYLQTIDTVFLRHALPEGTMTHRGVPVEPEKIKRVALMTVEGELDDILGAGQTKAAHKLCTGLPKSHRLHHVQPGVGHFGVFNGSRFRAEVAPRITEFITNNNRGKTIRRAIHSVKKGASASASAPA